MSSRPKPRPLITNPDQVSFPPQTNKASFRYSREFILQKFNSSNYFLGIFPDEILPLYLHNSEAPCTVPIFSHSLQEPINSRPVKKKEDFFESPRKRPAKTPKKPSSVKTDLVLTETSLTPKPGLTGLKRKTQEKEENAEENFFIVPVYDKSLLYEFVAKGNPFAKALIQTGVDAGDDDKIYFPLGLKPYERVWFYKDPEGTVQGPFSCIEMFNWTFRGCFPDELEISFTDMEFVPMNKFISAGEGNLGK